jgi:hypothetical protein
MRLSDSYVSRTDNIRVVNTIQFDFTVHTIQFWTFTFWASEWPPDCLRCDWVNYTHVPSPTCTREEEDIRWGQHNHGLLMIIFDLQQQYDKSDLCWCIVVCNPVNHVAEETLGSPTSKNTACSLKVKPSRKKLKLNCLHFANIGGHIFSYYTRLFSYCIEFLLLV